MHNEELHNLYSSPSIIRMTKSRRMRWTGHVARMGEKRNACRILVGIQKERDHLEDHDVGGWTIFHGCSNKALIAFNSLKRVPSSHRYL
jgi:hypothetical protein